MADINYTDEKISRSSDRIRYCKNGRSFDCKHKMFMAKDRRVKFCTKKCSTLHFNRIKLEIRDSKLKEEEANNQILHLLTSKKSSIRIRKEALEDIGFNFKLYKGKIDLEKGNFILKFGVFNVQRDGEKEILIYK